jgi:hypothetical protein
MLKNSRHPAMGLNAPRVHDDGNLVSELHFGRAEPAAVFENEYPLGDQTQIARTRRLRNQVTELQSYIHRLEAELSAQYTS